MLKYRLGMLCRVVDLPWSHYSLIPWVIRLAVPPWILPLCQFEYVEVADIYGNERKLLHGLYE